MAPAFPERTGWRSMARIGSGSPRGTRDRVPFGMITDLDSMRGSVPGRGLIFPTLEARPARVSATRADTFTSIGVGLDSNNNVWVNNFGGATGNAIRVNRDGGTILYTANQPGNLYTYSDFTGYQLLHFTAPRGTFQRDYAGCDTPTEWGPVSWTGTTPPTTSIQLFVKVANTSSDLNSTSIPEYGPFNTSPADLQAAGVPRGPFLRVLFVLQSTDRQTTPVLTSFSVTQRCIGLN